MTSRRRAALVVALLAVVGASTLTSTPAASGASGAAAPMTAAQHLERILDVSRGPQYRRFGSPGMARAAEHAATTLEQAGYAVRRHDVALQRYAVDYSRHRRPLLRRVADGRMFRSDSVISITRTTTANGITCTVKAIADVLPGDCGFVPFETASPEWNNVQADPGGALDEIIAKGGAGAVVQGDMEAGALVALRLTRAIPAVVAVVDAADIIGQRVRLRVMGGTEPATAHNVVAVRRPAAGSPGRYLVLQGHLDGWYQAAADNGAGAAAVLAASEQLAAQDMTSGLIVALYDAEEWGLLGSKSFAGELSSAAGFDPGDGGGPIRMGDLDGVVNLDASSARATDAQRPLAEILGQDAPLFSWRAMVYTEDVGLPALFLGTMAEHGVLGAPIPVSLANPLNGGIARTDGRWFVENGVPVVWPVAGYPAYHTDADTIDAVDLADLANVTAATVDLLLTADATPEGTA